MSAAVPSCSSVASSIVSVASTRWRTASARRWRCGVTNGWPDQWSDGAASLTTCPCTAGGRFSAKARGPSCASSDAKTSQPIVSWIAIASASDMYSVSRQARRIAWVDSGPQAATCSATARAASSAVPSGTTRPMSPIRSASVAGTGFDDSRMSIAIVYGIWRGSRIAEPPSGNRPRLPSHTPKVAFSPAMRMSVPWSISVPPATA